MKRLSEVYCGVMSQNSKLLVQREEEESFCTQKFKRTDDRLMYSAYSKTWRKPSQMVWGSFAEKK